MKMTKFFFFTGYLYVNNIRRTMVNVVLYMKIKKKFITET